jgi:hypothetical protein
MLSALLDVLRGLVEYVDYWLTMASCGIVGLVIKLLPIRR